MKLLLAICILSAFVAPFSALTTPMTLTPYLTPHFSAWLNKNGYGNFTFERTDINAAGSYGGKADDKDTIVNDPIIFFHGNSDQAIGEPSAQFHGFVNTIQYFQSQGYKESELYVTTWGPANPSLASQQYHSYTYLNYLRNFVEAVLKYTKAKKINIIAHSMGVTLARKVIKGGKGTDGQEYDLGAPLTDKVDIFLGMAGANLGLVTCYMASSLPTCGKDNGFYPGRAPGPIALSTFLDDLNKDTTREGETVFDMLSTADDLIGFGDIVWGKFTSKIPGANATKIYNNLTHMGVKDNTIEEQYQIITTHAI